MKKSARDLKKGDKITLSGKKYNVDEIEISDIGKQGKRKCRLVLISENNEKIVIVRPEDYPFVSL